MHRRRRSAFPVLYESREARDAVLRTPMADGMSAGYDRLEELLAALGKR